MHEFIDKEAVDPTGESAITALIDGDSISYIVGYNREEYETADVIMRDVDNFVSQILVTVQGRQYAGFLSPKLTFRNRLYPEYKANRKAPLNPSIALWKPYIEEHLRQNWGFVIWDDHEADDAVAALQVNMDNTIICSPDKDLKQIPGNHFDYKKGTRVYINPEEANYFLWYQVLLGDSGDNIKGCPGVGKVGAKQVLDYALSSGMRLDIATSKTFAHKCGEDSGESLYLAHNLVMLRSVLTPPELRLLSGQIHTFDLDAAGIESETRQLKELDDADNIFGDW